ncbi:MAG: ATP-dependent DNA ligase [Candidatus Hadarchaeota archaeon]
MKYHALAEAFEKLEKTASYLEKNSTIVALLKETPAEEIERVVLLLLGRPWPAYVSKETGVGPQQLKKAISLASGYPAAEIDKKLRETGDFGEVAQLLISKRRQASLFQEQLTVEKVFESLRRLPEITGGGSVDRKMGLVSKLLADATPTEARFIVRTVLGDLRIGVAEGRLRDAIATAFGIEADDVEHAYMLTTDYSLVAKAAAKGGKKGLKKLGVSVGHPVSPMLAQRAENADEILKRMGGKAAFEIKLDGIRIQVHKDGGSVQLFTRRMEDYTNMFPDILGALKRSLTPRRTIVDGELVAIDKKTGKPMPFQEVLKRRRKYEIGEAAKQIPVQIYLFDVLLVDDKVMMDEPYEKRRAQLKRMVQKEDNVIVVEQKILNDPEEIQKLADYAVKMGHEGLLSKDIGSTYRAGRREFLWLKLKPTLETLDLVVVGAIYGRGRRAGSFGSYVLAAKDEDDEKFKTVTKCGSGYTDEDLDELTKRFKEIQVKKPAQDVDIEIECDAYIEPRVVFEIAYEEIQRSPSEKHTSGYGLRFPRFIRVREDKKPEDISTTREIGEMYKHQEERKAKGKSKI